MYLTCLDLSREPRFSPGAFCPEIFNYYINRLCKGHFFRDGEYFHANKNFKNWLATAGP